MAPRIISFAYGSNMSSCRLLARVRSARFLQKGQLFAHALRWHKRSVDGSGKCDAFHTGEATDFVWGILFEISVSDKSRLDEIEGQGYGEKRVDVVSGGRFVKAAVYVARHIDPLLAPYHWYKKYVLDGAREHGLPPAYVRKIEKVPSWDDPDPRRAVENGWA